MSKLNPQTVRGMIDILPEDQKYWSYIIDVFEKNIQSAGFLKIDTPIVEKASLFERPIGKDTDIVEKEMYVLENKKKFQDKERLVLRPECTASVARAYIEHGMKSLSQPVQLYYYGPMFRHDRPQKGRLRQFYQLGAEVLGEIDPFIDAQIISISVRFLKDLKIGDFTLEVNSIGSPKSRQKYIKKLQDYFLPFKKKLCPECQNRLKSNPLRLLDCKNQDCSKYKEAAPQLIDYLDQKDKIHFMEVLEYLEELSIPYEINTHLVRGLDYYTRTVFEIWPQVNKITDPASFTLGGGGRYDNLIETIGGFQVPGIGFSFGVERIIEILKLLEVKIHHQEMPDVFVVQLGKLAKKKSLKIIEDLRSVGFKTVSAPSKDSIKTQLKMADKLKSPIALIIGQKEVLDGTLIIRDMSGGFQETIRSEEVVSEIEKRLPRNNNY